MMNHLPKPLLISLVCSLFVAKMAVCQIPVTVNGFANTSPALSPSYSSFNDALTALNAITAMSGPVTIVLASDNSEKAPSAKGFTIGSSTLNPLLSSSNTVTIKISGTGPVNLYAASGTTSLTNAPYEPDGILKLIGADYVTIDGLTLRDTNTITSFSRMEFGIGLFKRNIGDGCNHNTIKNCTIFMSRANNSSYSGTIFPDGSTAILAMNAPSNDVRFHLEITNGGTIATNGTNSENKILGNSIIGGNNGVAFIGYPATSGVGPSPDPLTFLGDLNNVIGGPDSVSGNRIINFGGGGSNPAFGVRIRNGWGVSISRNFIDNNDGTGNNHSGLLHGIYTEAGASGRADITSNIISLKSNATSDPLYVIRNLIGSTAAGNKIRISKNIIKNCTYNNQSTGSFYAISNSATADSLEIKFNEISQISLTSSIVTSGVVYFIHNSAKQSALLDISNNVISDMENINSPSGVNVIFNNGATENILISGNILNNIKRVNTKTGSLYVFNNQSSPSGGKLSFTNNSILNMNPGGVSSTFRAFNIQGSATQVVEVSNNSFTNIDLSNVTSSSSSSIIYIAGTNVNIIHGNIIKGVNNNRSNLTLLFVSGAATSCDIYSNQISDINTGATTTLLDLRGLNYTIFKNKIFNVTNNSSFSQLTGFSFSNTSSTVPVNIKVNNNLIGHFFAPSNSNTEGIVIMSFDRGFSGSLAEIYYNTVYLNASSNGSVFGASIIKNYNNTNGITLDLRNNVLINTSTPAGITGYSAIIRCPNTSFANYFASGSNNNFLYGGVPDPKRLLYYDGNSSLSDIDNYKSYFGPKESNSVTDTSFGSAVFNASSFFESLDGNDVNFLKPRGCRLSILDRAQPLAAIPVDFSGANRNVTTPDMGAWEVSNAGSLILPIFDSVINVCKGQAVSALPTTSANGIQGSWTPALNNTQTTVYTFQPNAGQCADSAKLTIVIKPILDPQFDPVPSVCAGKSIASLQTTSKNGIMGSWSPALNNTQTTTYIFTPDSAQCADTTQLTIVVRQIQNPVFDAVAPVCAGRTISALPTTSSNGILGSWSPALNNTQTTTYVFTPDSSQCADTTSLTIKVNAPVEPVFDTIAAICAGRDLDPLPSTSINGISGSWSPVLNNIQTTFYIFSPDSTQCADTANLTIRVNPSITPAFDTVAAICVGENLNALPTISKNGISGTWSPALDNTKTTTYTFSPNIGGCVNSTRLTIVVKPCVFAAYPNPNNGEFYVSIPENIVTGDLMVQMFDAKGARVFEQEYGRGLWMINARNLASGIYLIVFRVKNGVPLFKTKLFIKP